MTKTVLVTGASKGIGRAVAIRLARQASTVVVHCRSDVEGAEETLAEIRKAGSDGRILSFDIADRTGSRAALEADIEGHGAYWGIVLCAGIARDNAFPAMEDNEWDNVLGTNLDGFYNVLRPTVMPMVSARKGGRIVALSSVSGLVGNRGQVNYSAAKAGIIGAAKALAIELAKRDITVNCVAPGIIDTQMVADIPRDEMMQLIPMRRLGTPEDVAAVVAFLVSDDAGYVTRQVVSVNGGMV